MRKLLFAAAAALALAGCHTEFTGATVTVGEQMALPQITDTTDSIAVNIYESVKGAKIYSRKDSLITITYRNVYTNEYFGIVTTREYMDLSVKIEPLDCGPEDVPADGGDAE